MLDRRRFLGALAAPAVASAAALRPSRALAVVEALAGHPGAPGEVAADEAYWREAQQAFTVDRSLVTLNNGGVSPSPAVVQAAMKRHLDYSNQAPPYTMWQVLEPQREPVRERLARFLGCDAEEIALTRNASEGLQICQCGFDLEPGDEVLTTTQDYPRMIDTFRQREAREGIVLRQVAIPVPAEDPAEVVRRFEEAVTERTRLILVCHVINLTGQILPVREVAALGRRRGIPVVVDGAHGFAHFPFTAGELDCDYYATSLHKWLFAPHGTGLLYVRRERIAELWPLTAPPERLRGDIRKFEEIGTHPAANTLAIAEALTFHLGLGPERKAARLRYLTRRWAERLLERDRVRLHTSLDPRFSCGLATVQVEGVGACDLARHLWEEHRILVTAIEHPEVEGVRVTPSVYTTLEEVDRFCEAVEALIGA
ncbi:MAG TPA: aminotransferase class V-fold PLP-dependent enzyme [Thermoanaerobaculia bacterium]|nr:aminotransferase class V-fold PLP-dependent enzyme [Thermoanaerobaculia bacterium]